MQFSALRDSVILVKAGENGSDFVGAKRVRRAAFAVRVAAPADQIILVCQRGIVVSAAIDLDDLAFMLGHAVFTIGHIAPDDDAAVFFERGVGGRGGSDIDYTAVEPCRHAGEGVILKARVNGRAFLG